MSKPAPRKAAKRNPHLGSTLDDFLTEEGIYDEVADLAAKKKNAQQLRQRMEQQRDMSVSGLAQELGMSRTKCIRVAANDD